MADLNLNEDDFPPLQHTQPSQHSQPKPPHQDNQPQRHTSHHSQHKKKQKSIEHLPPNSDGSQVQGGVSYPPAEVKPKRSDLATRLNSILSISSLDGARPPSPSGSTKSNASSRSRKGTNPLPTVAAASTAIASGSEPASLTNWNWMSRVLSPASLASAGRKASSSLRLPQGAILPTPTSTTSTKRNSSTRSVSAPSARGSSSISSITSGAPTSPERERLREEPVVLNASPRASEDLQEALNEEIFAPHPLRPSLDARTHFPAPNGQSNTNRGSGINRPERAHLSPAQSPLSPPPHPSLPHAHPHTNGRPELLTTLTRSTLPTASLSLQPLPQVHLSSTPSNMRRSTSLFSKAGMGLLGSRSPSLSTGQAGGSTSMGMVIPGSGSIDQLRLLYSSPITQKDQKDDNRDPTAGRDDSAPQAAEEESKSGWAFADWFRSGSGSGSGKEKAERDQTAPLLEPRDRGRDGEDAAERIQRRYKTPKNPLIFCHGLLGFDELSLPLPPPLSTLSLPAISHWRGIADVLRTNGVEVYIMRVPATSGIEQRARVLREKIEAKCRGRRVHLVGHSMGGLDCRYLTSRLEYEFEVLTVTTVSTPHRGSSFADYFVHELIGPDRLPAALKLIDTILPYSDGDGTAFQQLTTTHMRTFNEQVPDKPGVRYFSWGATYEPGLVDSFRWPWGVIYAKEGPNDGLVSVESAKWGQYEGTVRNVNHLDLIGWMNAARYRWAEFVGNKIEYRPGTFYLGVASRLAEVEEEMEQQQQQEAQAGGVD